MKYQALFGFMYEGRKNCVRHEHCGLKHQLKRLANFMIAFMKPLLMKYAFSLH